MSVSPSGQLPGCFVAKTIKARAVGLYPSVPSDCPMWLEVPRFFVFPAKENWSPTHIPFKHQATKWVVCQLLLSLCPQNRAFSWSGCQRLLTAGHGTSGALVKWVLRAWRKENDTHSQREAFLSKASKPAGDSSPQRQSSLRAPRWWLRLLPFSIPFRRLRR